MARILIIEDDSVIREGVMEYLSSQGYHIDGLGYVDQIDRIRIQEYDLLILDVMLPGMDGFQILDEIRQQSDILILMITALSDDFTQIRLFDLACDDYLAKPFSLKVLERRVEALLKRGNISNIWRLGDIEIDFDTHVSRKGGREVDLKLKEIQLLKFMSEHPNRVLSRSQLIDGIYGFDEAPLERVIDVYVKNLRKKLGIDCIKTVKGAGYLYEV